MMMDNTGDLRDGGDGSKEIREDEVDTEGSQSRSCRLFQYPRIGNVRIQQLMGIHLAKAIEHMA